MIDDRRRPLCVQLLPETQDAGAENQARYLLEELARRDEFEVELAYFGEGRAHSAFEAIGAPMMRIPRKRRFRFDLYGRCRRIRAAYRRRPPDILQTWLLEGNVFGLLAARAWPSTAVVISNRGSWNEFDYPRHVFLQKRLIGRADHAISNSTGGAAALERMGMPATRISVIANGIPAERLRIEEQRSALRTRLGWDSREVVAWVGRANDPAAWAQKDFNGMLDAARILRESHPRMLLALIGLSEQDLVDNGFELPPWAVAVGQTDRVPDYLNAVDAVAISSRAEGHSNVAGEALMLGLAVATTDCGGHTDAVEATGGRVVPIEDPGALATALGSLLDSPPERDRVREVAGDAFSVERMARRTTAVYERILAEKRSSYGGPPCVE